MTRYVVPGELLDAAALADSPLAAQRAAQAILDVLPLDESRVTWHRRVVLESALVGSVSGRPPRLSTMRGRVS